jgi:hypothetical protein
MNVVSIPRFQGAKNTLISSDKVLVSYVTQKSNMASKMAAKMAAKMVAKTY